MNDCEPAKQDVIRIDGPRQAREHIREITAQAKRTIDIFSHQLSSAIYDDEEVVQNISDLVRRSAQSQLRVLVRDTRPLYKSDRPLVNLTLRLTSHASIRRYTDGASDPDFGFVCVDEKAIVYLANEPNWIGYARYNGRAESRNALEEFSTLWTYGSREDPNLRRLNL